MADPRRRLLAGTLLACFLAAASSFAHAQSIAPQHYRTSEGIEVIVGRQSVPAKPASAPEPAIRAAEKAPGAGRPSPASAGLVGAGAPAGPARVSVEQQATRDKQRIAILLEELINEGRALEAGRQALRSPRAKIDLTTAEWEAVRDANARHESNIKTLNDEIRSAKSAAGSQLARAPMASPVPDEPSARPIR